jgi:hypothetical protein
MAKPAKVVYSEVLMYEQLLNDFFWGACYWTINKGEKEQKKKSRASTNYS